MKPTSFSILKSNSLLQKLNSDTFSTVSSIEGTTKLLGKNYKYCQVVLYDKKKLLPVTVTRSDVEGNYSFKGLRSGISCFVVAFDSTTQYNAIIQDNIIPQ